MKKITLSLFLVFISLSAFSKTAHRPYKHNNTYSSIVLSEIESNEKLPDEIAFKAALKGYLKLQEQGKLNKQILSIIDFNLSSNEERFWVIDMQNKKLIYHTLVAHGRNSGNEYANSFSNKEGSYQSSLGFYLTGQIYNGKHGNSLKLLGLERNINDAAYNRGIVIHGADYVSEKFIAQNGRLGRSLGCPAVPENICVPLVNTIQNGSCLFIYKNDQNYFTKSQLAN